MRVGIDLVSVDSVDASIREHGARYLERIHTERELHDCHTEQGPVTERLAARFAAKEATIKVLRPAPDTAVPWRTIEVVRHSSGWVALSSAARRRRSRSAAGLHDFALSITHEQGHAAAVVVAEESSKDQPRAPV